ncbi:MAG: alanine--tRNA ligase [Candidatus Moraniibacteriota bacterium]|nr:MAG: alanine--tRNA ligase [Candidatus Moranbacteria bacterium]
MTAEEIRQKYIDFFESRGHAVIPSASIVPENDPTTLFITAGMHPLVPYLMGEKHPKGTRLVNAQKCIRTIDIDEVGDTTHHTFFEMLGNWSLGDYFKEDAIYWSWEFLTSEKWLGLDKNRLAVSVFEGENFGEDNEIPFDDEAYGIWKKIFDENNLPESRIAKLDREANWWGPASKTGPCGPDTEMFYWVGDPNSVPESFNDDHDNWVEIWNDVFMEYYKDDSGVYTKMEKQNVDTGMGLVRVLAVVNGLDDNYKTDLFTPIIAKIEEISGKKYDDSDSVKRSMRIIADHITAAVFMVADAIEPSNSDRGYILRRLIRRAVRQGYSLSIVESFAAEIASIVQKIYENAYPEVHGENILRVITQEEEKFAKTLQKGEKEIEKFRGKKITGDIAFDLFQTYGYPVEMTSEVAKEKEIEIDKNMQSDFEKALAKHQELSRTASSGMFKGGLADNKEETTQLHTAAHLMLAGLRKILGDHVHQKGSNINGERIRFDFSHPEKLTAEEKQFVEDYVNDAIAAKVPVTMEEMSVDEAKEIGAEGAFENKYGDVVKVYTVDKYSKEICGGPHVTNTGDITGIFKIKKEQSSSAGVRRIKAILVQE